VVLHARLGKRLTQHMMRRHVVWAVLLVVPTLFLLIRLLSPRQPSIRSPDSSACSIESNKLNEPLLLYPFSATDANEQLQFAFSVLRSGPFAFVPETTTTGPLSQSKAVEVLRLLSELTKSNAVLSGGRAERLTTVRSVALGGEPLELRELLIAEGVSPTRLVLYTGSRVTTHNINLFRHYLNQILEFEPNKVFNLFLVEEAYLIRRIRATALAAFDALFCSGRIERLEFVPSGAPGVDEMIALHQNHKPLIAAFLVGEIERLFAYSESTTENKKQLFSSSQAFVGLSSSQIAELKAIVHSSRSGGRLHSQVKQGNHELKLVGRKLAPCYEVACVRNGTVPNN